MVFLATVPHSHLRRRQRVHFLCRNKIAYIEINTILFIAATINFSVPRSYTPRACDRIRVTHTYTHRRTNLIVFHAIDWGVNSMRVCVWVRRLHRNAITIKKNTHRIEGIVSKNVEFVCMSLGTRNRTTSFHSNSYACTNWEINKKSTASKRRQTKKKTK